MKAHAWTILTEFFAAVACSATFLLALLRQCGLVEAAASLGVGLEVFFLSSSIGDLLEDKKNPNQTRLIAAVGLALGIVGYFLITKEIRG